MWAGRRPAAAIFEAWEAGCGSSAGKCPCTRVSGLQSLQQTALEAWVCAAAPSELGARSTCSLNLEGYPAKAAVAVQWPGVRQKSQFLKAHWLGRRAVQGESRGAPGRQIRRAMAAALLLPGAGLQALERSPSLCCAHVARPAPEKADVDHERCAEKLWCPQRSATRPLWAKRFLATLSFSRIQPLLAIIMRARHSGLSQRLKNHWMKKP